MPTPSPALKREPRWRTRISPPVTTWPAKIFTPRNWGFESRPFLEEPRPFLCAIWRLSLRDLGHPDARELLAVTGAATVAALRLELVDPELGAAQVLDDLGGHGGLAELVTEEGLVPGQKQGLEVELGAGIARQPLDEEGLALFDAVLLATGLDDRVHEDSRYSEVASALAAERRRPPLRPRRRGLESTASSSPSGSAVSSSPASAPP